MLNCKPCPKKSSCVKICKELDYQLRYYSISRCRKNTLNFDGLWRNQVIIRKW